MASIVWLPICDGRMLAACRASATMAHFFRGAKMNIEGRIDITLQRRGEAPAGVRIESSRQQLAQKLLVGRAPEEAANLIGLIFSLCGNAQRIAAEAACEAALGLQPDAATRLRRDESILLEMAREHAWQLLLNWPEQAGGPLEILPDKASLLRLAQAGGDAQRYAETLNDLLQTTMLGGPADTWLTCDLAGFDAWRGGGNTQLARLFAALGRGPDIGVSQIALLPPLHDLPDAAVRDLAACALAEQAFCAQPLWRGAPAETGAVARLAGQALLAAWIARRGRGAGARMLARLLELAALPALLARRSSLLGAGMVRAWAVDGNCGVAAIETSRGLLLHVVRLHAEKIVDYRIVAPTEWNFHPSGALFQALSNLAPGNDLSTRAGLVTQALDPCVAFGIHVSDEK
jgi:uptake hydrogenase large subunit